MGKAQSLSLRADKFRPTRPREHRTGHTNAIQTTRQFQSPLLSTFHRSAFLRGEWASPTPPPPGWDILGLDGSMGHFCRK
jgi:hypothetical protein